MIEFEDVSLVLSQRPVLENLSFRIESGQLVLLVGGSGTGKSSILRLILRLIPPTSGRIRVLGEVIDRLPEKRMNQLRQQIGLVFQEGALFDSLTVEENVGLFLIENLQLPMETVHQRVEGILESLGLAEYMNYYPSQLSGGMKKRVAIARAIVSKPQMLLYDEPTAGLDPITAKRVVGLMEQLQEKYHMTALIVTHELHYFLDIAERLMLLKNGAVAFDGPPDLSILEHYEETHPPANDIQSRGDYGNPQ